MVYAPPPITGLPTLPEYEGLPGLTATGGDQLIFESMAPGLRLNPVQRRQYSSLFQPTFNAFMGELGAQIARGEDPTLSFTDYLQNQFDPTRSLLQMSTPGINTFQGGPTAFNFFGGRGRR